MRWKHVVALPFLFALAAATPPPDPAISYQLAPVMKGKSIAALDVTIRLRADKSGITTIDWLDDWAGEKKLSRWARDVTVRGAWSVTSAPNGGRIVRSAPGARLVMHYRIVSAYAADPTAKDSEQARPVIRPDYFYSVGEILYARPVGRDQEPVGFVWKGPKNIGFASDTEHDIGLRGQPRNVADMLESIAIGGHDLVVASVTLNGAPVRVAHVGKFGFDIDAFTKIAQQVVTVERDFWRDTTASPFLITAIPLTSDPGLLSFGGTGRSDAFANWIDRSADLPSLTWLLAHEYFHSWNVRQLGRFPSGTEAEAYWMSEGFTDFYARRLMLRAGLWTPQKFTADWNEMLRAYAASPFRSTPNTTTAAKFWSGDNAAEKIPYQRGALLAALWDRQLRARGGAGLDDVLRAQRGRVRSASEVPELTAAFMAETVRFGLDVRPDIERYLTKGEALLLPEDAFGTCATLTTADLPVFERGWDSEATAKAGNFITSLDPASNAYAAGIRNGMKFLRRTSGEPGNAAVDYVLELQDGTTKRIFTFRPAGKTTIRTQQIILDAARFKAEPDKCKAALAG